MQKLPCTFDEKIAAFRRQLDFCVLKAALIHFLGNLGCMVVFLSCIIIMLAGIEVACVPEGLLGAPWLLFGGIIAGSLLLYRRRIGDVPSRLMIARYAESKWGELGESISRAVEFLGDTGFESSKNNQTRQLCKIAIMDAAEAAKSVKYFPIPYGRTYTFWIAAGCFSVVVIMASLGGSGRWAEAVKRQCALAYQNDAGAGALSSLNVHAADQVSDAELMWKAQVAECREQFQIASRVQNRLSKIMSARFAAAPGQRVEALRKEVREDLRSLAEIYEDTVARIQHAQAKLVQLHPPIDRSIRKKMSVLHPEFLNQVVQAIELNQLANACSRTTFVASILHEVALALGGGGSPPDAGDNIEYSQQFFSDIVHAELILDEIEQRDWMHLDNVEEVQGAKFAASFQKENQVPREPYKFQYNSEQDNRMNSATSTDPRFVAGGVSEPMVASAQDNAERRVSRRWSMLPEDVQIHVRRGGFVAVPLEYQQAMDLYYGIRIDSTTVDSEESDLP
ncbi:MAG: hypothetical protein ABGW78_05395 [Pirellulales bacterium]